MRFINNITKACFFDNISIIITQLIQLYKVFQFIFSTNKYK